MYVCMYVFYTMYVYVYSGMFLGIYAALGFSQAVFVLLAAFALALVNI